MCIVLVNRNNSISKLLFFNSNKTAKKIIMFNQCLIIIATIRVSVVNSTCSKIIHTQINTSVCKVDGGEGGEMYISTVKDV